TQQELIFKKRSGKRFLKFLTAKQFHICNSLKTLEIAKPFVQLLRTTAKTLYRLLFLVTASLATMEVSPDILVDLSGRNGFWSMKIRLNRLLCFNCEEPTPPCDLSEEGN